MLHDIFLSPQSVGVCVQAMQQFKTKDLLGCDYTVSSLLNGLKSYKVEKCEPILSCVTRESSP